jgi:oligopeptidase A
MACRASRDTPEHVEPALRQVLDENRRRIAAIEAPRIPPSIRWWCRSRPCGTGWPCLVAGGASQWRDEFEPLRVACNACLPLLSEYSTDLAQNEAALYRALQAHAEHEGPRLMPCSAVLTHALRDPAGGRGARWRAQGRLRPS